jgi:mono/diheme cytochrome c family protein
MAHTLRKRVQRMSLFAAVVLAGVATMAPSELTAAPQAKTVWDGVYTEQQAARGSVSFAASCARCHSSEPNAGEEGKALAGAPFWQSFRESTVDHLLDFVSKSMPNGAGGTLSANTYADLVAFILSKNGLPAGSAELTKNSAAGVKIIAKDGPGELPNGTLVRVVGCVARKEGGGWILNRATAPERPQNSDGAGADDAVRALGERSYPLMFLLTSLESYVGHRMSVRGLLIGDGGRNGINVSTTQSVSPSCQ